MKNKNNINRALDLRKAVERKSVLLLGPRQTGKSWAIRQAFSDDLVYNLLDSRTLATLAHTLCLSSLFLSIVSYDYRFVK